MNREPLVQLESVALPVPQPNVDTDQILPARYLQKPRSADFASFLFRDLRYRKDGSADPHFLLNQPAYAPAKIVVGGPNFGCGSSREHAVWALYDHGFRVAIASGFGDIFRNNALKNGLLPVVLPEAVVDGLLQRLLQEPGSRVAVDVERQVVTLPRGATHRFDIDPFSKRCLLEGLDELGYTLTLAAEIARFEQRHLREGF